MPVLTIPNQSPAGWTPGTSVGVLGGIEQYLPGGANQRTTLRNVVTTYGADNTGAADVVTAVNSAVTACANNDVVYFPYGLFRFTTNIYLGVKQITIRGAGEGVVSTSSVAIPTSFPSTKVFTVASGLGWTSGIGIRIWHVQDRYKWMQGTVTSYSGTTLTVSITSTSGHTDTLNLWTVGQTVMTTETTQPLWSHTGGDCGQGIAMISGSPSAGATTITTDGTYIGSQLCQIDILTEPNGEVYHHYPDPRGSYAQYNWITNISGSTITLARPLIMDLPVARAPRILASAFGAQKCGHEYYALFGAGTVSFAPVLISFAGVYNSWIWHCQLGMSSSYMVQLGNSVGIEIAYSFIGENFNDDNPNAAAFGLAGTNYMLMRHCINDNSMQTEGVPDYGNVFIYNLGLGFQWTANHGSGSRYRLFEGNILTGIQFDGYHGSCKRDTVFKNWLRGDMDNVWSPGYAFCFWARYTRESNTVGNVIGRTGVAQHALSYGYPPGGSTSGETVHPALYVSSGGTSGSLFRHDFANGDSRLTGVIASHSGTTITVTLDSPNTVENALLDPRNSTSAAWPISIVWGTGDSTLYRIQCTIVFASSSGSTVVIDGATGLGTAFPSDGTVVAVKLQEFGHRELDASTAETAFSKKNYLYGPSGSAGSIDVDTTDTLPNSLAYAAQPADWPGSLTWPPVIDPTNPNASTISVIPAGVYYNTGEWPSLDIVGTAPTISITSPSSPPSITLGNSQTFIATASDVEDGSLTSSIVWTSNIDGSLGTGGTINPVLSLGNHSINAAVTDSDSNTRSASITATVTAPTEVIRFNRFTLP